MSAQPQESGERRYGDDVRRTPPDAAEQVAALPRRTAHAVYALLQANNDGIPSIASEIVMYDYEARSSRATAAALREGWRHGLCGCSRGVWFTSAKAYDLKTALEDRFLADTEGPA